MSSKRKKRLGIQQHSNISIVISLCAPSSSSYPASTPFTYATSMCTCATSIIL